MELLFNLIWSIATLTALCLTVRMVRRGRILLPMASAIVLVATFCFILLPAISLSDDLLEVQQATLPLSGQVWRNATEVASESSAILLLVAGYLLMAMAATAASQLGNETNGPRLPIADRLIRSQRLRPPLSIA